MYFNFEVILFYATVISGVIALFDVLFLAPRRKRHRKEKMPLIIDYARSFFPILLIVFILRSFAFEPFRIPTGSLEPTLMTGDFILVNKFAYGMRLPILHNKIMNYGEPQRGDIMIFRWPPNPGYDFIKRVIGLPGDHISYVNKELTVNGIKVPQTFLKVTDAKDEMGNDWKATEKTEDLLGVNHLIFVDADKTTRDFNDVVVPPGNYFVMGDNRDDSADSRFWGFVPEQNIVGKAILTWMSWDKYNYKIRFNRIGKIVN